jgi:hypothetical protein
MWFLDVAFSLRDLNVPNNMRDMLRWSFFFALVFQHVANYKLSTYFDVANSDLLCCKSLFSILRTLFSDVVGCGPTVWRLPVSLFSESHIVHTHTHTTLPLWGPLNCASKSSRLMKSWNKYSKMQAPVLSTEDSNLGGQVQGTLLADLRSVRVCDGILPQLIWSH